MDKATSSLRSFGDEAHREDTSRRNHEAAASKQSRGVLADGCWATATSISSQTPMNTADAAGPRGPRGPGRAGRNFVRIAEMSAAGVGLSRCSFLTSSISCSCLGQSCTASSGARKGMAAALGVTGPQRLVLRLVGLFPGLCAGDLAAVLHMHPSALAGVLQRLGAQRLLVGVPDPSHRRRAVLRLAPKGARADAKRRGTVESAVAAALTENHGSCSGCENASLDRVDCERPWCTRIRCCTALGAH